ncbi:MAG: IclR family transcriptional regulator, partial [Microbacterium sp.]
HRALASLRRAGLAAQRGRGSYVLGDEFLRIAFRNHAARPDTIRITPVLEALSRHFAETTHFAVLDGAEVVYRAKTDPDHGAVRLTSEIGGRNPAYRTAVGKVLLSHTVSSERDLRRIIGDGPLEAKTPRTITDHRTLWKALVTARERGFAIDDQENEPGVNCIALPVRPDPGSPPIGAISISALAFRTPLSTLIDAAPLVESMIAEGMSAHP